MKQHRLAFSTLIILVTICVVSAMASLASAQFLGVDNNANLFSVNTSTGAATLIGPLPTTMTECVSNPINGNFYAQESDGGFVLYRIDPLTGASLGSVSTGAALNGMAFVGGTLYGTAITSALGPSDLVTVDPTTGTLTYIGATGFGPISGLAYDTGSGTMYGITGGGSTADLITLNLGTGAGTVVGSTGLDRIGSIRFENGILYGGLTSNAGSLPNYLVRINTSTAAVTPVGDTGFSITGLALDIGASPQSIPTLSEWGMIIMSLLLAGSAFWMLRKRQTL